MIIDDEHAQAARRIVLQQQGLQARPDIGLFVARWNDHDDARCVFGGERRGGAEVRQQAALVEGSRDQPRHDGEPCAGEQQLHSVTITAPEPERAGRSSKNQPLEPGLSSACRKTPCRALARSRPRGNRIQNPDRWTLNATALTNCRRNSKPLHASVVSQFGFKLRYYPCVAFCGEIARARCAAASERRSQP